MSLENSSPSTNIRTVEANHQSIVHIGNNNNYNYINLFVPGIVLSTLPNASEAAFDSHHNQYEATCLQDTRAELLRDIKAWVEGPDESCVFWLTGMAGTGKSTIARTIAKTYYGRDQLGGSFFFSKGGGDISKADKLVTTLAQQLASAIPLTEPYIYEGIKKLGNVTKHSLHRQWEALVIGPLSKLNSSPSMLSSSTVSPSTVLFVIDALDECGDENDIRVIPQILTTYLSLSNIRLRIFITSRPETPIRSNVHRIREAGHKVVALHDIPSDLERGFDHDWPGEVVTRRLVENSFGLFIWASTACRFIREGNRFVTKRINKLINVNRLNNGPGKHLDKIYTTVLQDSIPQNSDGEGERDEEEEEGFYLILRQVLGSVLILCSPLSMESLSKLLVQPLGNIKDTLADLHPIVNIPDLISDTIRLHHPTFRDFLLDRNRCTDANFWVNTKEVHKTLAKQCMDLMSRMLKSNICGLKSPDTLVKDVDRDLINQCIPPELQYACLYWVQHCNKGGMHLCDGDSFHVFFRVHFLHWLEAINLIGKSDEMGSIIRLYHSILVPADNLHQTSFVKDARRYMFAFHNVIKKAPLQAYMALMFIPPTNGLKYHFQYQMLPWIQHTKIAEPNVPKAKDEFNYVSDLAFTHDSTRIASGSNFEAVRLWNVAMRAKLWKYEGAMDKVSSVAISPDGMTLAAGSDDWTVMAWEIETRRLLYSLKAHSGWVNSVVFSPDSKLLASGSMDATVALWNAETGQLVKRIHNQLSCVNSAAFSPDGSLIATGSLDNAVRLWDIFSKTEEPRMILDGHSGCINCVRFSGDGRRIVTGSDDMTIKIWDAVTGAECGTLKGHTKKVMAVAFSVDACLIASGSEDKTVRIWDANDSNTIQVLRVHTSGINSVIFSPNNKVLASSSFDDKVHLWDTVTWAPLGELEDFEEDLNSGALATQWPNVPAWGESLQSPRKFEGHSQKVTCVLFSSDSEWLASGSEDATIKLWQKGEGYRQLEGHSDGIKHLIFSPDNRLLASASSDKTVRLWETRTGMASHTLEGHSTGVTLILFSSNGRLLASCSDATTRLWNPKAGIELRSLEGHSAAVNGLAFSPDNGFIASCSIDTTILLWDLGVNSEPLAFRGHSGPVESIAFSSDGALLVSCSEDTTIRLWKMSGATCIIIDGNTLPISRVAFSPDSQLVVSCTIDGTISLWDTKTKSAQGSFQAGVMIRRVSFSHCGRYVETDRG
ncbi:hypothetical protein N7453_009564, partial [Penicillium expansum]